MKNLSAIYMGSGAFGIPSLEHLLSRGDIQLVAVTQPDRPAGRGKTLQPTLVAEHLLKSAVPVKKMRNVNVPDSVRELEDIQPDLLLVCDFGQILKPEVLQIPKLGPFNLHGSLLPAYRGASPIRRAILDGAAATGVTLLRVNERCDAGPVISKIQIEIKPDEDYGSLHKRLSEMAPRLLKTFLDQCLLGTMPEEHPQNDAQATAAPKIRKGESQLSFDRPAGEICRRIRAFSPEPGAFALWNGLRLKLLKASAEIEPEVEARRGVQPGTAGVTPDGRFLTIRCAENTLLQVEKIQLEGKRASGARELLNGRPDLVGSVLTGK